MVREEGTYAALPVAQVARCVEGWIVGIHGEIWWVRQKEVLKEGKRKKRDDRGLGACVES